MDVTAADYDACLEGPGRVRRGVVAHARYSYRNKQKSCDNSSANEMFQSSTISVDQRGRASPWSSACLAAQLYCTQSYLSSFVYYGHRTAKPVVDKIKVGGREFVTRFVLGWV